ncbi:MAG: OB-fold domain-containing protein, partial [Deltaproteobacteria bacterium]|nr:OB-fold domain-containing protein [Deltaproteobacteria bacterium]
GLRLATNIVECPPQEVQIGMAVEVVFERNGEVHVPLFRPCVPPHGGRD